MDIRDELTKLPDPDPAGVDRVWQRYEDARRRRRPAAWMWAGAVGLALVGAAAAVAIAPLLWNTPATTDRTMTFDATSPPSRVWSEQVSLDADGRGVAMGTDRNVEIDWESGTLTAHVVPNSGTKLAVVTDEARVEVVGTVFSVTRDRLGVSTRVERGEVAVTCADGWAGSVTPQTGPHTCLPVRPALLLQRADALDEQGADDDAVLDALDRGLAVASEGSIVASELFARRMQVHLDAGRLDAAVSDGRASLQSDTSRAVEIRTNLGRTLLTVRGCAAARPWLEALGSEGSPIDRVLLAECLATTEPDRASELLRGALDDPALDETMHMRAQRTLDALEAP